MNKKSALFWALILIGLVAFTTIPPIYESTQTQSIKNAIYLDPNQPLEARVNDLLSRLTLKEKIDLLTPHSPAIPSLQIPELWHGDEALHGVMYPGNYTVFPECIMLGSTFDVQSEYEMADMISNESRAAYNSMNDFTQMLTFYAPNINLARDPRWGRTQETYGEDPWLTSQMAIAYVEGLQGTPYLTDRNYSAELKAAATPKHFAFNNEDHWQMDNGTIRDRGSLSADISEKWLRDYEFAGFQAAIEQAHAQSIMAAYNAINGIPCCANPWLLTTVLRNDWGFKGYVVTDCGGIGLIKTGHNYVQTYPEACAVALKAGVNMECDSVFESNMIRAIDLNILTENDIDQAVIPVLESWFELGIFNPKSMDPYANIPASDIGSASHLDMALKLAEEGIVLLKNEPVNNQPLLPIDTSKVHNITVIGPGADTAKFGDYSATPISPPITPLAGITARAQLAGINVTYVAYNSTKNYAGEIAAAESSDLVILVCGLDTNIESEGLDRTSLNLPDDQIQFLNTLLPINPNTVVLLNTGSSVTMNDWVDNCSALLNVWYPGEEGGTAIANILFGDVNPSGRLPLTFYNSINQLPAFDDYDMSKNRTYMYLESQPLFPFGYGLSYTNFTYSNLVLNGTTFNQNDTIDAQLDVKNNGTRDGDDVVQIYIRMLNSNDLLHPNIQLKGFQRVTIPAGQTRHVGIPIKVQSLQLWNTTRNAFEIESGSYQIFVSTSGEISDIQLISPCNINGN